MKEKPGMFMQAIKGIGAALNYGAKALGHLLYESKGAHDLTNWVGHGGAEFVNMGLQGHVAPLYGGNLSPPEQQEMNFHAPVTEQDNTPKPTPRADAPASEPKPSEPGGMTRHDFYQIVKEAPDLPDGKGMIIDIGNVTHSDPISPSHTPRHAVNKAQAAQDAINARIQNYQPPERGMSR